MNVQTLIQELWDSCLLSTEIRIVDIEGNSYSFEKVEHYSENQVYLVVDKE
jgi:hypothetical protein